MTWLNMVAPACKSLVDLESACEEFPERQLLCLDHDGADRRLLDLVRLVESAGLAGSMPEKSLRDALLLLLDVVLQEAEPAIDARLRSTPHCDRDVALLEFEPGRTVMVTLSKTSDDLLRHGLTAHERIPNRPRGWTRTLLVLPDLYLRRPLFVTTRVTVANLSREVITAALMHLARG